MTDLNSLKLMDKYNYKAFDWKLRDLRDSIKQFKNNRMVLRFLSDYFYINIFLLNVLEDKVYAIYPDESFNTFKSSIMLAFHDGHFEPLVYEDERLWNHEVEPLKKLINVDKQKITVMDVDFSGKSEFQVFKTGSEDLNKYIKLETEDEEEVEQDQDDNNQFDEDFEKKENHELTINDPEDTDVVIEEEEDNKNIFCTKKEIDSKKKKKSKGSTAKKEKKKEKVSVTEKLDPKMKLDELQALAAKYGISLESATKTGKSKNKTKAQLIEELKNI